MNISLRREMEEKKPPSADEINLLVVVDAF
jgi:hypothetical protein